MYIKGYTYKTNSFKQLGNSDLLDSQGNHILIHMATTFDAIMNSVFTRTTKKVLSTFISFTDTKGLATVTDIY